MADGLQGRATGPVMFSLLTNTSAMTAMRSLQATQRDLDTAERQMATGLRVSDASDNPATWSIATAMRAQLSTYGAMQDGFALDIAGLNVAKAGLNGVLSNLNGIQSNMVTASQPGVDLTAVQQSIAARQSSIRSTMSSATFNGVSQFSVDFGFTSGGTNHDALSLDLTTTATAAIKTLAGDFGQVIRNATATGADIGSRLTAATTKRDYYSALGDAVSSGIGALVDADLGTVATRIQSLRARQQLGTIALSIANNNSKLMLKLFGA